MPTTLTHLLSLSFSLSHLPRLTRQPAFSFSSRPRRSSELLLSQSNVCVYLINAEALLITATGGYVAWMVTRRPGQERRAASEPQWNLDRDAAVAWHLPAKQLVLFLANLPTSLTPVCVSCANSTAMAYVLLWTRHRKKIFWSIFKVIFLSSYFMFVCVQEFLSPHGSRLHTKK